VASKRVANEGLPVIAHFEVRRRNYLASDGSIDRPLPAFAADTKLLVGLYRAMVLLRLFDRKAVALQRGTACRRLGYGRSAVGAV
jgi:2-oxoisovalerate dehydrogenase E1 component alpha subunit